MCYRILNLTAICTALAMVAGCATSVPVSEANLPKPGWPVEVYATQQEVTAEASATNPMMAGGGLLGVVITSAIDKSRNQKAEDAVTELRDLLIAYPVSERFAEKIVQSGVAAYFSTTQEVAVQHEFRADFSEQPLEDPMIRFVPKVAFSNDLSELEVSLVVAALRPDDHGKPEPDALWTRYKVVRFMDDPEAGKKRKDYARAWADLGLEALQMRIEQAMDETLKMAAAHVAAGVLPLSEQDVVVDNYSLGKLKLSRWREDGDYVWAADAGDSQTVYGFFGDEVELETGS